MGEDEFKPGDPYDKMPEVRVINIVEFLVRDDHTNVVEPVVLSYEKNPGEIATDKFNLSSRHFVCLHSFSVYNLCVKLKKTLYFACF